MTMIFGVVKLVPIGIEKYTMWAEILYGMREMTGFVGYKTTNLRS